MGSYEGSSDWDDEPASASVSTFVPRPAAGRSQAGERTPDAEASEPALEGAPAVRRRLNAIFAFDTTGSMTPWVENVQEKMEYLAVGLLKLLDMEIGFVGVGDHGDGRNMLQIKLPSADPERLKQNIRELQPTDGRDTPEAFECLFKVLNAMEFEVPTVLILLTDSIPHGMEDYTGEDDGCPFGVDWQSELEELQSRLKKVYLVTCASDAHIVDLQRRMVGANGLIQLANLWRLTNLIMAICMDEVGELDFFMKILEKQRGPERRQEVLRLLGRSAS